MSDVVPSSPLAASGAERNVTSTPGVTCDRSPEKPAVSSVSASSAVEEMNAVAATERGCNVVRDSSEARAYDIGEAQAHGGAQAQAEGKAQIQGPRSALLSRNTQGQAQGASICAQSCCRCRGGGGGPSQPAVNEGDVRFEVSENAELKAEIAELKSKSVELMSKVAQLEAKNAQLKTENAQLKAKPNAESAPSTSVASEPAAPSIALLVANARADTNARVEAEETSDQAASDQVAAAALHRKYEQSTYELAFHPLAAFSQGLEHFIGAASPRLEEAMRMEHCTSADSQDPFTTGNYGITTTTEIEYATVTDPASALRDKDVKKALQELGCPKGKYPAETTGLDDPTHARDYDGRIVKLFKSLESRMNEKNAVLEQRGEKRIMMVEVRAGRLYTGPAFVKYNLVLRSKIIASPPFIKAECDKLCKGNKYATTIHTVNSLIVKLSKLTKVQPVYRGSANGVLPKSFWEANAEGSRGGIDGAFMSTTTKRDVAVNYAGSSKATGTPMVLEMAQSMVSRGAELFWLSQYPHEAEVLFCPMTCVEFRYANKADKILICSMMLTVNMLAPTIEKVIAKLKVSNQELIESLALNFKANGVAEGDSILRPLCECSEKALAKDGEWFNDAENYQAATSEALAARGEVFRYMLQGGLQRECLKAFAAFATTAVDPELMRALAVRDRLEVGMKVLAPHSKTGGRNWIEAVVTKVGDGKVDVEGDWGKGAQVKTGWPLTRALVVREAGVGALVREAAAVGNLPLLESLIEAKANVLVADEGANTALHLAAAAGHVRVCRMLVAEGADKVVRNVQGHRATGLAFSNKQAAVIRLLEPTRSDEEFTEEVCTATSRLVAAAVGDVVTLEKATETDEGPHTALMVASRAKQPAAVRVLLQVGTGSVNAQSNSGCTALSLAAEEGDERIVKLLLEHGADTALADSYGYVPLYHATAQNHPECVRLLLEAKADMEAAPSRSGWTVLMAGAKSGYAECVHLLLEAGVDKERRAYGMTALEMAAERGHEDVCELLA